MDIFYPIFEVHFFVFMEGFFENYVLVYGMYSRAGYDGVCTVFNNYGFYFIFAKVFILDLNHSKMYLKYQRLFELQQNACRGEGPIQKSINESSKKNVKIQ